MKKKVVLISTILVILAAFFGYKYLYQPHRDIASEKAEFTLKADQLSLEISENEETAVATYLDKVVVLKGEISEIVSDSSIVITPNLICIFAEPHQIKKAEGMYEVKGRFVGYDDLLEEIQLDDCQIIK